MTGELEKAIRARGMKFAATFHHAFNWWFFPKAQDGTNDCSDPSASMLYSRRTAAGEPPDEQYLATWRDEIVEVIDNYQPDLLWFDFGLGRIKDRCRREMLAYYYNRALEWGREVVVTYKQFDLGYNLPPLTGLLDFEVGKMNELTAFPWISDTSIDVTFSGAAWSHVRNSGYKSVERPVHNLIDRVSKNGYLLLNVNPRADGTIPEGAQEALRGIGKWLEINGEAIFGTVPWCLSGEGPTKVKGGSHFNENNETRFTASDVRYTIRDDVIYAICLGRPGDVVTLKTFAQPFYLYADDIKAISMVGGDGAALKWWMDEDGLNIHAPKTVPSDIAVAFKITTE